MKKDPRAAQAPARAAAAAVDVRAFMLAMTKAGPEGRILKGAKPKHMWPSPAAYKASKGGASAAVLEYDNAASVLLHHLGDPTSLIKPTHQAAIVRLRLGTLCLSLRCADCLVCVQKHFKRLGLEVKRSEQRGLGLFATVDIAITKELPYICNAEGVQLITDPAKARSDLYAVLVPGLADPWYICPGPFMASRLETLGEEAWCRHLSTTRHWSMLAYANAPSNGEEANVRWTDEQSSHAWARNWPIAKPTRVIKAGEELLLDYDLDALHGTKKPKKRKR
jgi:hypothetical protein